MVFSSFRFKEEGLKLIGDLLHLDPDPDKINPDPDHCITHTPVTATCFFLLFYFLENGTKTKQDSLKSVKLPGRIMNLTIKA